MKERLPRCQKEMIERAKREGLIASTYNCEVEIFTKTEDNQFRSVIDNSKKAVDIKEKAIEKTTAMAATTPHQKHCSNNNYLKRLRTSPGEDSMQQKAPRQNDKSAEHSTGDND